jgi:hypothetical protein
MMLLFSCTDNETKYVINTPAAGGFVLTASKTTVTLAESGAGSRTAIAFQWDSLTYGVSTPVTYTIQMDTLNGNFTSPVEEEIATNTYSISYSDSILNKKLLNQLKLKGNVQSKIKVRLQANLAFGNLPVYSDTLTINVTPYIVAKVVSYLYMPGVLSANDYTTKICSRENDGIYEGYVKAAQWANFNFTNKGDGTGTWYGSTPNSLYSLDSNSDKWNIWFDEGGYFLVKADLNTMTWSKKAITSVCVTGDFNSWSLTSDPMTYDETNKVWTASCNISTIGWGLKFVINGDWTFFYGSNDTGELTLGGNNIVPASTGTKTITMDLSKPEKYTYTIQ